LSFQPPSSDKGFQISNPKSKRRSGLRPSTVPLNYGPCKRCLSPNHQRLSCRFKIKCWNCKQEGHISKDCPGFTSPRAPVVIHGDNFTGCFSSYPLIASWQCLDSATWFKQPPSLTGGPNSSGPRDLHSLQDSENPTLHSNGTPAPSPSSATPLLQENPITEENPTQSTLISVHPQ
jgi:hypothetical protein